MRLFHVSDTHLGYTAYRKVSPESGLNQREEDVYRSWREFIDITVNEKPDLVIHSGDLFDSVRPSNRAIAVAFRELLRLSDAGIPVVIISGNHDTPRLKETGSIFRIFDHIPSIHPVYLSRYEKVKLKVGGKNVVVHAVPHIAGEERFKEEFNSLKPEKGMLNIAVLHGCLVGLDLNYITGEFNEIRISSRILTAGFDYIALGHYHEFTRIGENCVYSGSTERLSFTEAGKPKGFVQVEMEMEMEAGGPGIRMRELQCRDMKDLGMLDAANLDPPSLTRAIEERIDPEPMEGAVVRLKVRNVPKDVYRAIDHNRLERLVSDALYFQFNWDIDDEIAGRGDHSTNFRGLLQEFNDYLDGTIVEGMDKERLKELGAGYFERSGVGR